MNTFRTIMALWPSRSDLAADCRVQYGTVKQWHLRDSIPADRWLSIVQAASARGITGVSLDTLAHIAASKEKAGATNASL